MAGKKSNPKKKERCKAAWARGQERKKQLISEAAARHEANVAAGFTPWARAEAARRERRKGLEPQIRDDLNVIIKKDGRRVFDTKEALEAALTYKEELAIMLERRNAKKKAHRAGVSVKTKKTTPA